MKKQKSPLNKMTENRIVLFINPMICRKASNQTERNRLTILRAEASLSHRKNRINQFSGPQQARKTS
jgi:hypothetical protein